MAGTASRGIRAKGATDTDAAPAEIHVRSGQHGHITDSQRFCELHQHRQAWRQTATLLDPFSQDADMPTSPASTGRDRPLRSRRIWMRSPVR
jgi:ferric-dicitrate binding protein FerR (iron transport regulator)